MIAEGAPFRAELAGVTAPLPSAAIAIRTTRLSVVQNRVSPSELPSRASAACSKPLHGCEPSGYKVLGVIFLDFDEVQKRITASVLILKYDKPIVPDVGAPLPAPPPHG